MKDIFNKRQRFSIRKFSVGAASVLIGIALFTPSQGVLAATENNLATEIGANSEIENVTPTVEKKEEAQRSPENQGDISSPAPKDTPIGSTRTTEFETSGNKENNSLTTRTSVAGEDRSSTPAVRAASNPSEVKKYELTEEDAKKIKAGIIGSEGDKYDSLLLDGEQLKPNGYTDNDYLSDKDEIYIYEKDGKRYVGYNSHPLLEDTDGDGIIDSDEKPDEKLKWNVSERDMIMFMELSYRDDKYIDRVLNHKNPLREAELYKKKGESKPRYEYMMMNRELAPYWKRKKSYHTSSGLDAVLFETKSDFPFLPNGTAQVLAFRGTSDGKDIIADGILGTGSDPKQAKEAEGIMRELAKDKSITNLYLTGHSLGGYLVQRAMVEAYELAYSDSRVMSSKEKLDYKNFYENILKKGTTFNAPKVRTGLLSSSAFWQKGLDSKKIAQSGKMTHYIVNNDSTIGKSVSNDSDVVINVGNTKGGHSSRSYFEADMINRRPEFISGKRISLDGIGFQNPKITTAKSLEKVGETAVYSKRGDNIIKLITVSMKDPDTGNITTNTTDEIFKKDGAKDKVETTEIPSPKKYVKDDTREKGQSNVEAPGKTGEQTVTTTYSVNPNTGDLIEHVGQPVVKRPETETVVKVAAKDEVEYIKKGDDVVKKTTSYTVDPKTGSLTSTDKEEVVNKGGAKDIVEYNSVEPKPVYLKDENRPKGTDTVQFPGKAGTYKVTTTYSVNPVNGTLTPSKGKPEVVTLPIARVVKVGAKDKVVETPIEPEVEYVRDGEREVDTPNERVEGAKGKTVVTTTYDVDSKDGHITEHVGTPVVTPAGKTIVKVGAKTKVEQSKDSEGRDVIDTTTYEVDSKTGKVTPTTVRTYGKTKEPTVAKRVVPSPVVYEKDGTKEKGTAPTTVKGEDGEDTITTTYTVDANTGKITASEGKPVRTKEPTATIVKVAAKDKVETTEIPSPKKYVKDDTRDKNQPNVEEAGRAGSRTVTTTYEVNPADGTITERVGEPVVVNPTATIVKVAAKDKVETTEIPSPKKYVKDDTRDKGQPNVEEAGQVGSRTITTTYSVDPTTGAITETVGKPVVVNPTATIVKVAAKDKVETTKLPSPKKYVKDDTRDKDQPNVEEAGQAGSRTTTTTYEVNPADGTITERVGEPVVVNPTATIVKVAAKDKVVETPIEPEVEYVRDVEKDFGTPAQRTEGEKGKTVTTTTYDVDPNDGHITEHVGNPVVTPAGKTIVKVGAKTKVERNKDDQGRDVIDTTTYEVDPKTGKVTPTTVRTYGIMKAPTVEKRVVPSLVVYEKDDTKEKGTAPTTVKGEDGEDTITTTYTVDPNTGKITASEGQPVRTKAPTNTIVKVAAKDKVVETPIEPEVEYVRDGEREVDTPNYRVEGAKGKTVTTITYDVDSTDGHITEHVGNPVVTPAGKTIVKVGAKTKVEQSKDSEGHDVIDTTTYEVDPKTGKVTPTTVRTYGKTKAPMVEKRVVPSPVVYEKDDTKEKGTAPTTVKGEDGEDTITTIYTVDPNTGKITANEGQPVRTKEPTNTIVKVAAKDKVETTEIPSPKKYVKDDTRDKGQDNVEEAGQAGSSTITTTYSVDPTTGAITETVGKPVVVNPTETIVKVPAKDKVETTEIPSPKKYVKDDTRDKGQDNVEETGQAGSSTVTTTYEVNPSDGTITERVGEPVVVNPTATIVKVAAKDKVVETPIEPEVEYIRDSEREVGTPNERVEGAKGKTVTTTTYDVDSNNGHITEHVGNPVVSPAGKTIVKVGAKTKVEQSKDSEGHDVIDTTTYEVDPKTGKVTPTTVRTYGKTKAPTVEKRVVPSPVVYEKDDTKEKGTAPTTVKGEDGEDTITTTYTVDPNTGKITASEGQPVRTKAPTNTIVKVPAKDKVETTEIPSPKKYVKDDTRDRDQPNVEEAGQAGSSTTTTIYSVDSTTGAITERVGKPVVVNPTETIVKVAAKDKVVETPIEPEVEYVKDVEKDFGTPAQRIEGERGKTVTTITYDVDPDDGHITEHVGNPVVTPAGKTIVKVGAKTKVEQSKDSEGHDVIDTTTYEVDSKTGKVTPTTVRTYGKTKAPTVEKRVVPSPVVYEKDDTKEKGTAPTTVKGEDGEDTITTIYTVDPNTGKITANEGQPVRTKEPTNTIVKVAAKDKVVEIPIEPEVEYVRDGEREVDTPNERVEGAKGKTVTTTTYDVDPDDGHITEHVGNPVVTPAGKTIVKVGAKTKVEQSKDSEGRDVIDTTTYEVDPKTGKVTPTTVRTYGKTKAPTVEKRVVPSPVVYEKDDTKEKGTAPTTVKGEDGEDTITTTYTVDTNTGKIIVSEGKPVRTKAPTNTIVKVPAKDKVVETPIEPEVEYVRDGEREVDTPNDRVEGAKGKTVTTTTYDVDPNDGHITEHVGNPVVTLAGKTIVKVGAKTKVEQSKDSEGRDVIDTTTYEVDPKTGKVTPTTVRTYGKTKEPKVELEQDPKTGDVTVTPKKPDGSTYPPGTKVEISGKDGNPIVVTIDEDGKGKVPNSDLPNVEKTGTGKITEPGKSSVEVPKVTTFENDALSGSIALPELMIEVRWIDEDGNVLKPSVKTGNEKDAEHGSIPVYEFVRTVIDENEPVITHIFRKVSGNPNTNTIPVTPVTPATNGVVGQDTPSPTTPTPDAVTPNANHGSITTTIDKESKSKDSQNVLPILGTESDMILASLGLLGMLSSLGLAFGKKKED